MPQPNMQQMLKQVQKMQAEMVAAQEQMKDEVVEASAGGGMVTVKVSGDLDVKSIAIDPEAVDPEDVELLQDMVLAAVNEGLRAAQELASKKLGGITGGLGGPGGWAASGCPASRRRPTASPRCRPSPRRSSGSSPSWQAAGIGGRTAQRLAFHLLRPRGGRARARRRDPRGEGADRAVRDLLRPRRRAALPHLRRRASRRQRSCASSRSRPTSSRSSARTSSTGATTCSAARCRRSTASIRRTCGSRSCSRGWRTPPANADGRPSHPRGRARDQPDDDRRGDRVAHRGAAARAPAAT